MLRSGLTKQRSSMGDRNPWRAAREAVELTFRGSRADLERVTALRLQTALVLIFLAGRCVHLAQAGVDLALAGGVYSRETVAAGLGAACLVESVVLAIVTLRAGRLVPMALLGDALFGMAGLAAMSVATVASPGRAGSLNWMLPYTVAGGDLGAERGQERAPGTKPAKRLRSRWPAGLAVALAVVYLVAVSVPHRLHDEGAVQIWGNAANYPLFFAAAAVAMIVLRRRVAMIASRNAEVTRAAAELAHEAQWRAVTVDVFGPVVDLLDRITDLGPGPMPPPMRAEADRLIAMIEAVRPAEPDLSSGAAAVDRVAP